MADLAAPRARLFRFGPFELDVRAGELRKHGIRIKLREQPVQILLLLLEHPGEVVLREEIRLRLWPNNTIVEFDHGINAAIQKLRDALGESADAPRYVETVARRGYRFLGEVERVADRQPAPQVEVQPEAAESGELSGKVLSHYRILDKLGEGGMGVVYRAEDLKLGRQVALKFLPCPIGELPESVIRRFEREARAASALNHPHICAIHGLEDFAGQPVIVMELVEGETLAARLAKGPLPLDRTLDLAIQIAGALAEAHRKGIVHRDLKPANIMLTKSGVKVLDFGLAKMQQPLVAAPETVTIEGAIMGTLHYMSPEQAQGQEADARSDIFSFGTVLYEMLAGRRAFDGATAASVIAAILEREPTPLDPAALDRVVRHCLAKDPDDRWQSARDLRTELEWVAQPPPAQAAAGTGMWRRLRTRAGWIVAGALTVGLAVVLAVRSRDKPGDTPVVRFTITPPEKTTLRIASVPTGGPTALALSPDGRRLAFVATSADGTSRLWIRPLDTLDAQPLSGTEGASVPFWSPDSRFLGFWAAGKLKKIDPNGGPPINLCDAYDARGGTWNREGVIVFAPSHTAPLFRIAASGGASTQITKLNGTGEVAHRFPRFLPDGRHFLFAATPGADASAGPLTIRAGSLDSPDSTVLLEADSNAVYAVGHLLFLREGTLMAQPFDPRRLATTGEAVPVAEPVRRAGVSGRGIFDASENGMLVYQGDVDTSMRQMVWFDRTGKRASALGEAGILKRLQFSPDRKALAVVVEELRNTDIWLYDLTSGRRNRFTFDPAFERNAIWSTDSRTIVFSSNRNRHFDLYRGRSDASGAEELLYADQSDKYPSSLSPDGRFLLYTAAGLHAESGVWVLPVMPDQPAARLKPFLLIQGPGTTDGQFSPDGRWIAYASGETGRSEIYVRSFNGPDTPQSLKIQISASGGFRPRWRRDGKEIFFISRDEKLTAAEVGVRGNAMEIQELRTLFGPIDWHGYYYDVSVDGQRILAAVPAEQPAPQPLTLVQNWTAALKK